MSRFKVIDAEFWIEISDSDFEISDVKNGWHRAGELCYFLKMKPSATEAEVFCNCT